MRHKRKRLKKLLMAIFPRDTADLYIRLGLIMDLNYSQQIHEVKDVIKKHKTRTGDS